MTDFLTRAREQGYEIPKVAFDLAVDNLRNRLAYAADFQSGGEDVAYALYVLARNGRASIGDLRYYAEAKLDAFATPMAKAQIGGRLALYGDRPRSDRVFRAAQEMLQRRPDRGGWRSDFGSGIRDGAALLTLAAEAATSAVDIPSSRRRTGDLWEGLDPQQHPGAGLDAARRPCPDQGQPGPVSSRWRGIGWALYRSLDPAQLETAPLAVRNLGDASGGLPWSP